MFRNVPCRLTREQLLSHVDVGRLPIHAVFVTIVLGVDVECYLLVDGSPHHQVLRARRFNRPLLFTECVIVKQYFRCDVVWVLCICTLMTLNNPRHYQRA